jgi:hypothetical protein
MRFTLRSLLIAATIGPPLLAGAWFIVRDRQSVGLLIGFVCLAWIVSIPLSVAIGLVARRRYLLWLDRRERHRSGLFSDGWPDSP